MEKFAGRFTEGQDETALLGCGHLTNSHPTAEIFHGGSLTEARQLFPGAPEPFLDLSTGVNPIPYPLPQLDPEWFTRLPEPDAMVALQTAAARAYGVVDPAMVVAAPGTQILIDLIPRLWPLSSVAVLGPTYGEHAPAWGRVGCAVRTVEYFAALDTGDVGVLCNPNNPDGRRIPRQELLLLADRLAVRGGMLLVDEAFIDLEGDGLSVADALPHPALIVLRSFGKTYGLAGLRLGFALSSPAHAHVIRGALGPWAVSGPAIAIGCAALADHVWRRETASRLANATRRLDALLALSGMRVLGGTCLFRLIESDSAGQIFIRLGRAGIFVRRFGEHPTWLRFGQPADASAWRRLERVLLPGTK
jgi:cobalamin biosynthesis protein CobC